MGTDLQSSPHTPCADICLHNVVGRSSGVACPHTECADYNQETKWLRSQPVWVAVLPVGRLRRPNLYSVMHHLELAEAVVLQSVLLAEATGQRAETGFVVQVVGPAHATHRVGHRELRSRGSPRRGPYCTRLRTGRSSREIASFAAHTEKVRDEQARPRSPSILPE